MYDNFMDTKRYRVNNPLIANSPKWSSTLTQFVSATTSESFECFDHFVGLALKGLCDFGAH